MMDRTPAGLLNSGPIDSGTPQCPRHGATIIARIEAGQINGRMFAVGSVIDRTDVNDRVAGLFATRWIG